MTEGNPNRTDPQRRKRGPAGHHRRRARWRWENRQKTYGLLGGFAGRGRQEARLHPRSLQPVSQLSLGNQLLALFQCFERGIQPGPLATFPKWKESGRHVKKGEKALTLCMPLTCKRNRTVTKEDGTEQEEEFTFTHFTYKAHCYHERARIVLNALKTQTNDM